MTLREQARDAARNLWKAGECPKDVIDAVDAASDVWEPLLKASYEILSEVKKAYHVKAPSMDTFLDMLKEALNG